MKQVLPAPGNNEDALRHYTLAKQEVAAAVRATKQVSDFIAERGNPGNEKGSFAMAFTRRLTGSSSS